MTTASPPSLVLARIARADGGQPAEVRLYVQSWQGRLLFHARWFTKAKTGDTWHPTTKGVTFRDAELAVLEAAVAEAQRILASDVAPAPEHHAS